jgi:hypothetical protein
MKLYSYLAPRGKFVDVVDLFVHHVTRAANREIEIGAWKTDGPQLVNLRLTEEEARELAYRLTELLPAEQDVIVAGETHGR